MIKPVYESKERAPTKQSNSIATLEIQPKKQKDFQGEAGIM